MASSSPSLTLSCVLPYSDVVDDSSLTERQQDDKVGAALSMTYVTGQPILFVGCGQTYTDLRHLRVNHIVQALLSN